MDLAPRLVLVSALFSAGCAANSGKYAFSADDFDMSYVDSKQGERNLKELDSRVSKQLSGLDTVFTQVTDLTKPLPDPVKKQVCEQTASIKGMVDKQVKGRVMDVCHKSGGDLVKYLASYDVFNVKDANVRYDLIEPLKDDDASAKAINPLIAQANDLLKSSYKVTKQFAVDKALLEIAKKDVKAVKDAHDLTKLAGIGIVTVSIARSSMTCMKDAQGLAPRLQKLADDLQVKIKADPMLALKLGGTVSQVGGVTANLAGVTTDIPGVLGGVSDLLKELN
ncbi:MAG: hypothetical protein JWM80_2301 [Cyanobacteria bacterium RYN_339]|nr:hypothetical protein [Cyanobacteria bacterium RYN_339]